MNIDEIMAQISEEGTILGDLLYVVSMQIEHDPELPVLDTDKIMFPMSSIEKIYFATLIEYRNKLNELSERLDIEVVPGTIAGEEELSDETTGYGAEYITTCYKYHTMQDMLVHEVGRRLYVENVKEGAEYTFRTGNIVVLSHGGSGSIYCESPTTIN